MKKEDLFDMIGDIDNQYIQEAHMDNKKGWAKWGTIAACFALVMITTAIANHFTSVTDNHLSHMESSQIENYNKEEGFTGGKEEAFSDISNLKENIGVNDTYVVEGTDKTWQEDNSTEISKNDVTDVPADSNGEYHETVDTGVFCSTTPEFFGGSYINDDGQFVVVLTEDTPENRAAICKDFGRSENNTIFVMGTYPLVYLTELQEKISNAMVSGELPFVVSSGVYETINCIVVRVTTTDEAELAKLYALDAVGGAIQIGVSSSATIDALVEPKTE